MPLGILVARLRTVLVRDFQLDGVVLVQGDEHAFGAHKAEHGFEGFGCAGRLVLPFPPCLWLQRTKNSEEEELDAVSGELPRRPQTRQKRAGAQR